MDTTALKRRLLAALSIFEYGDIKWQKKRHLKLPNQKLLKVRLKPYDQKQQLRHQKALQEVLYLRLNHLKGNFEKGC